MAPLELVTAVAALRLGIGLAGSEVGPGSGRGVAGSPSSPPMTDTAPSETARRRGVHTRRDSSQDEVEHRVGASPGRLAWKVAGKTMSRKMAAVAVGVSQARIPVAAGTTRPMAPANSSPPMTAIGPRPTSRIQPVCGAAPSARRRTRGCSRSRRTQPPGGAGRSRAGGSYPSPTSSMTASRPGPRRAGRRGSRAERCRRGP
jgi:hypothetical protein